MNRYCDGEAKIPAFIDVLFQWFLRRCDPSSRYRIVVLLYENPASQNTFRRYIGQLHLLISGLPGGSGATAGYGLRALS